MEIYISNIVKLGFLVSCFLLVWHLVDVDLNMT